MKTLHLYLTRQILATLVMTVVVFTFVLILGSVLREILALLMQSQTTFWILLEAIGLLIPYLLAFALPMGMLTATLLTFGRFSADQELTAARASGVSLVSLSMPILILSVLLSGVCAVVNLQLAPASRTAYNRLRYRVGSENPLNLLKPKQYNTVPGGYIIYVDEKKDDILLKIQLSRMDEKGSLQQWIRAESGKVVYDKANNKLILYLYKAFGVQRGKGDWDTLMDTGDNVQEFDLKAATTKTADIKISDMTFLQLREKIHELEKLNLDPEAAEKLPGDVRERLHKSKTTDFAMPAKVQLHRMVSFSFACIGFTLVGIPLGIRAHRRETSIGIAFALGLALVYYSFIILGGALEGRAELLPHLIVWIPNFLFQGLGAVLLYRANKGV